MIFSIIVIVLSVIADQVSKLLCVKYLAPIDTLPIIKDIFHFTYVENRGAAFGMLFGQKVILVVIPIIAILAAVWYLKEHKDEHWTLGISLSLIVSGGIGNLIDRVVFGYVTDMFDFRIWPVFNVADIAVCVGAGLLILLRHPRYR